MNLDALLRAATSHAESVRVSRMGINPLLWAVALVTPLSLILAFLSTDGWLRVSFLIFATAPLLVAFVGYFVLLFFRPDLLQSEEYRLRRDALIAFSQGASPEILEAATELTRLDSRPAPASKKEPK